MIKKTSKGYVLYSLSKPRRRLGGPYKTREEALQRERQVQFFRLHEGAKQVASMTLEDLARFTVTGLRKADRRGFVLLVGSFSHLRGVRPTRGWLYRFKGAHIDGWLTNLDSEKNVGVFRTDRVCVSKLQVRPGDEFSWIDSYWKATEVDKILDTTAIWQEQPFEPADAFEFRSKGSRIQGKLEDGVPKDVHAHKVIPEGWDHEHCRLCWATIMAGNTYYRNERFFVCAECFVRFVSTRDLSFMESFWPKQPL